MKVLVTGHQGFVGRTLLSQPPEWRESFGFEWLPCPAEFDLTSRVGIEDALAYLDFDHVIHLAAQSNVPQSFRDPVSTFDVNVTGTVRLLDFLERRGFKGRFLFVSSGDVYGQVESTLLPLDEYAPVRPANPYAASKVAAEQAVLAWARGGSFTTIIARPFNHLGPGQSTSFSVARFADAIAKMSLGQIPRKLSTGRLDVTRDFLDVRDVLSAYALLLLKGNPGEIYNVCSGVERRLDDLIHELILLAGIDVELSLDPSFNRPVDLLRVVGSFEKLLQDTGWSPKIPFTETLRTVYLNFFEMHKL